MRINHLVVFICLFLVCVSGCSRSQVESDGSDLSELTISDIADSYYSFVLENIPETGYLWGVYPDKHHGIRDNSPDGYSRVQKFEDELLSQLESVDLSDKVGSVDWITHAILLQKIRSSVALRVCRQELWNVNHLDGWHSVYTRVARLQPIGSNELRDQSLERWSRFAAFIDQEIINLNTGLALGFSAPKTVVRRVIDQIDGLLSLEVERSPFYDPAARDDNEAFRIATRTIVEEQIYPAIQRYRDFLSNTYMGSARENLSVTANPDGYECYEASLQNHTTIDRSGEEVFELGKRTVAANTQTVIELGQAEYGLDDFAAILQRARNDPYNRFSSKDELLEFSRDVVRRAQLETPNWVEKMPSLPVEVVPLEEHEEGTGMSPHYRPGTGEHPAEYRIPLFEPENQLRGRVETTAFHEVWPGHHLQNAVTQQSVGGLHPVSQLIWLAGPGEGWAQYAAGLASEMGLYESAVGPILRKGWMGRGMVVDPGIHLFGWGREEAIAYLMESGRFSRSGADARVDRIAIWPGQLTAYDSGELEILTLRAQAEAELGASFDIREFHDRILEYGTIPLEVLRENILIWITENK